jgi:hypothetical protein
MKSAKSFPYGGVNMITVSKEQLDTVEYLLDQSAQGNHVLFDVDLVREVFAFTQPPMNPEEVSEVEHHIEKLISLQTIDKQKYFMGTLPKEVLFRVIKTYFNIVENNLFETKRVLQ